jgi:serine/threonine protein kinase
MKTLNIFMLSDLTAKLGDLGTALKVPPEEEAKKDTIIDESEKVGTPLYLAPEIWLNKRNTKATDIWALGVILYELCTFSYPYTASNVEEL